MPGQGRCRTWTVDPALARLVLAGTGSKDRVGEGVGHSLTQPHSHHLNQTCAPGSGFLTGSLIIPRQRNSRASGSASALPPGLQSAGTARRGGWEGREQTGKRRVRGEVLSWGMISRQMSGTFPLTAPKPVPLPGSRKKSRAHSPGPGAVRLRNPARPLPQPPAGL